MDSEPAVSNAGKVYEVVPANGFVGLLLAALFLYLIFRHFLFVLMLMDIILQWLRKFAWFPKVGKRRRTIVHWVVAMALFLGFLLVNGATGWLQFVPVQVGAR